MTIEFSSGTRSLLSEQGVQDLQTIIGNVATIAERLSGTLPDLWLMQGEPEVRVVWVSTPLRIEDDSAEVLFRAAFLLSASDAPGIGPGTKHCLRLIDGTLWTEIEQPREQL